MGGQRDGAKREVEVEATIAVAQSRSPALVSVSCVTFLLAARGLAGVNDTCTAEERERIEHSLHVHEKVNETGTLTVLRIEMKHGNEIDIDIVTVRQRSEPRLSRAFTSNCSLG
jgi:hypothetical protein